MSSKFRLKEMFIFDVSYLTHTLFLSDADVVDLNGDFDEEEHEKHMEVIYI
jgi:hypothetical protein